MAVKLFESGTKQDKSRMPQSSIVTGTVINNCDMIKEGKVLVRIPSLDQEVWARLNSIGAGSGAGFFYVPRPDDEVLIGLNNNEPADSYVIGGLWSTQDSPPVSNALESTTKRVIKTGLKAGIGHEVEFDDGPGQSITITTSTKQKISIDPGKIEISNMAGTLTIVLDNKTQTIKIKAANSIEMSATASIKLKAASIEIGDMSNTVVTTIKGKQVMIN
jgi:uncharacterized protein involved in type VI secretion and phage assembly